MAAAVPVPRHTLEESPNSRTVKMGDWEITARTNPISNANELDALQAAVGGIPLPEMTFGNNALELVHKASGWTYAFGTEEALKGVKNGELESGDGGVKVGYADAWLKSRTGPSSQLPMPETVPTKPYDWTYTTIYSGHVLPSSSITAKWVPADPENATHTIPLAELTRHDPILFYAEIPLYEDELHDNGSSHLLVRISKACDADMCFHPVAFTLRVDNVLFRAHDTRIYHSFSSSPPLVVRETSGWEAPYDWVKKRLPKRDDLTPLTDPMWIAKILSEMPAEVSQQAGAGTKWKGLGTRTEVAVLK
ncbi:type 2A phosphatase activator TIP41 [Fomitopsis serialis]|uniref:type 2A phosphatase activator TIP41 n=1 Tax=Fomitopsis serialis TaxID=139415 RepID=UPI002008CFBD|nr:type 2A phosphatase activator TIP41 [Neoantrodia serialis]KAH9938018.1 type 2A phosphatase activator TIP41 [Neoantrodia serialis]